MHHADPLGVYQSYRVSSTAKLLARVMFMRHNDKEHNTLEDYATLKGLKRVDPCYCKVTPLYCLFPCRVVGRD